MTYEEENEVGNEKGKQESSGRKVKKEDLVFEIDPDQVEKVKVACIQMNHPLIEEYDFKRDTDNQRSPDLKIEIKSSTNIRSY